MQRKKQFCDFWVAFCNMIPLALGRSFCRGGCLTVFQAGPIVMNVQVCPWHPWMQIVFVDLVRFLYGDHSKVGKSVTRFPDFGCRVSCSLPSPSARRVPPTWSRLVRCRSGSVSAEEWQQWQCHVLDLSSASTKFPDANVPR